MTTEYRFPYVAAMLTVVDPDNGLKLVFRVGSAGVTQIGLEVSPVPGFYWLIVVGIDMTAAADGEEHTKAVRYLVSPSTVVMECGDPVAASPLVIPETRIPTDIATAR